MKIYHFILLIFLPFTFFLFNSTGNTSNAQKIKASDDSLLYLTTRILDLSQRNLKYIPDNTYKYYNLEELDLSNNQISTLDPKLINLKKLKKLKLNFCGELNIEQVINIITKLPIEELEINNSILAHLPPELIYCANLKKLSLRNNYIYEIPEDILINSRLNSLDLANNRIDSLPESISAMKWLNEFDISNNPCLKNTDICKRISTIENLEHLKMDGAVNLTGELSALPKLTTISIENSEIRYFPEGLTTLRSLELSGCDKLNYDELFKALKNNDSLECLSLSSEKLISISNEIIELGNLQFLTIKTNNLNNLPDNLKLLKRLSDIKIQLTNDAQATAVFKTLANCENLSALDLSWSKLNSLPENIALLKNLKDLSLEGINLKELPSEIYSMQNLKVLNLMGDSIAQNDIFTLQDKLSNCEIISDSPYSVPSNLQKELLLEKESFTIDPTQSNTITTMNGSVIKIPANAFVDAKGKTIKTSVTVNFQPFYSPAQIYLSGIEMNYDSGGVRNSFMSAGMFNISANTNGKELALSKQKRIQVDFQSLNPTTNYNFYNYDNSKNNWAYKGKDTIKPRPAKRPQGNVVLIPQFNTLALPQPPHVPRRLLPGQNTTRIYYSQEEKRGRRKYDFWIERGYVSSNIDDEIPKFVNSKGNWIHEADSNVADPFSGGRKKDNNLFSTTRDKRHPNIYYMQSPYNKRNMEIYILPDKSNDRFNIVFKNLNDSIVITGYPRYHTDLANKVQEQTKKDYEAYLANTKKRKEQELKNQIEYNKAMKQFNEEMAAYRDKLKKYNAEEMAKLNNMDVSADLITRSLTLDGLGTWNCDIINRLPNGIEIYVNLYNKGQSISPKSLTLIDQTNNGYGSFGSSKIVLSCYVNNVILVKLDNNHFGYAKFTVTKPQKEIDLALNVIDTRNMNMKEFNQTVFN